MVSNYGLNQIRQKVTDDQAGVLRTDTISLSNTQDITKLNMVPTRLVQESIGAEVESSGKMEISTEALGRQYSTDRDALPLTCQDPHSFLNTSPGQLFSVSTILAETSNSGYFISALVNTRNSSTSLGAMDSANHASDFTRVDHHHPTPNLDSTATVRPSHLGETDETVDHPQEEVGVSGLQSTTPTVGNSQSGMEGSTNLINISDLGDTPTNDARRPLTDFADGAYSGAAPSVYGLSPILSTASLRSISGQGSTGSTDTDLGWDPIILLELSNAVRATLKTAEIPGRDLDALEKLLEVMLADEQSPQPTDLGVISISRFDKLLEALIGCDTKYLTEEAKLAAIISKASSLQHKWQQRFRASYFSIDEDRLKSLKVNGALHDIIPKDESRVIPRIWDVVRETPMAVSDLKPGLWWLNLSCVLRDGVTGSADEVATTRQGKFVLPLLTGTEVDGHIPGTYEYKKEGPLKEMHLCLMLATGRTIRVLRGYTLKSKNAPAAGIRYDGEYVLRQYKHRFNEREDNYSVTLVLDPAEDQMSMEELFHIPSPSQLDKWELYTRVMGDDIRTQEGGAVYHQWKFAEEQEEKARKEWHNQQDQGARFLDSLGRFGK